MNPGLWLLALRLARGRLRTLGRRARTLRGAVGLGGTLLFLLGFLALQVWRWRTPGMSGPPPAPAELRQLVAGALTVLALVSAVSERGLFFTPAETGFLFAAPVSRRELLLYNLTTRLGVQVLSGVWVSLYSAAYAPLPLAGGAAVVLGFVFMYVAAQALALGAAAAESFVPPGLRRLVRVLLIAGLLAVVASAVMGVAPGAMGGRFRAILASPVVRTASLVAWPVASLYTAPTAAAALLWGLATLALIAALVAAMLAFDVAFTERSLAIGKRVQRRLSRGSAAGEGDDAPAPARFRLRMPAALLRGRSGMLAWRQLTELLRTPRAFISPLVFGAVWIVATFGGVKAADGDPEGVRISVLTSSLMIPILFGNPLPFDFRRDLDRLAYLRSLPLRPWSVALGQIAPAALCFAAFELAVLAGAAALTGWVSPQWAVLAVGVMIPLAWAIVAVENGLFLLLPYRVGPDGRAGPQFLGKALLVMVVKLLTLALLVLVGGGSWWVVRLFTVSNPAALAVALLMLLLPCAGLTWVVGRTFARFDLSREVAAG